MHFVEVSFDISLYGLKPFFGVLMKCGKFGLERIATCIAEDNFPLNSFVSPSFSCCLLLVIEFISFLNGSGDFLKQSETGVEHDGHTEDAVDMESMHWTEQHFLLDVEDTLLTDVRFFFLYF